MAEAEPLSWAEFERVELRVGTVVAAVENEQARVPAYILSIDFGPLGQRTSSAQLTERYQPEELVGRQVVAVMNFPPKRIAGIKSEVLVLGAVNDEDKTVLLRPDVAVQNGTAIR